MSSLNVTGEGACVDRTGLDTAAMHHAIAIGLESTLRHRTDMPVGAVALRGPLMVGRGVATDFRLNQPPLHGEINAAISARFDLDGPPDTMVVNLEPCDTCQDWLALMPGLRRVVFGLTRADVAGKGLIKPHPETIFERAKRLGFPYEIEQLQDERLRETGLAILDNVRRNPKTEVISIQADPLKAILRSHKGSPIGAGLSPSRRFV